MDYILLLMLFIAFSLSIYLIGLLYKKIDYIKLIIVSISLLFILYVVISGFFFWVDYFDFYYVLFTQIILLTITNLFFVLKTKNKKFVVYWEKRNKLIFIIIFIGFLISFVKFDYFGMGQDEGVYQVKTIELVTGHTQRQLDLEEYYLLQSEQEQEEFAEAVKMAGFDRYDPRKPTLSKEGRLSPVSTIFHGIPTFPALLGLCVKILGLENMQQIQSIFYLCMAFFVLFATENLSLKTHTKLLSVGIVSFCPIIQWVTKSALTECFLCMIIAGFIYSITEKNSKKSAYLSIIFVWAYSFFHISAFTLIPLFFIIYMFMYFETDCKDYIYGGILAFIGFAFGNTMMLFISPTYSFNNISGSLTFFQQIGENKIMPVMIGCSIIGIIILLMLDKIPAKKFYVYLKQEKIFKWMIRAIMIVCAVLIIIYGVQICQALIDPWRADLQQYYGTLKALKHLTITAFLYGTGVVCLPIVLVKLFLSPCDMLRSKEKIVILGMFTFCVLIMSALLKKEIYHYYYFSRYLAPFIVVCGVMCGVVLDSFHKNSISVLALLSFVILAPFNWVLCNNKDDSRLSWDILTELSSNIDNNSAVIIDKSLRNTLYLPMKAMTHADVYPKLSSFENQLKFLEDNYENIYVIESEDMFINVNDRYTYIYKNKYIGSEDLSTMLGKFIEFPLGFKSSETNVSLLKYNTVNLHYDFTTNNFLMSGFGNIENNQFRWINSNEAAFTAYLDKQDYIMSISTGAVIPFGYLNREEFKFDIYANNKYIQSYVLTPENMNNDIRILIPSEVLNSGKNNFSFSSETWSPTEYGSKDSRNLAFSISEINFNDLKTIEYDFGSYESFSFDGFSGPEVDFRWTDSFPATILSNELSNTSNYHCEIQLDQPINTFGKDYYEIKFVINGNEEHSINIKMAHGDKTIKFDIDKTLFYPFGDENKIEIYSELWSPQDYGSTDTRNLGIAIDKIIFTQDQDAAEETK